jgi:hypothetical protein
MLVNNVVVIVGKVVVVEIVDRTSKVRWNLPLDTIYVHCRVGLNIVQN